MYCENQHNYETHLHHWLPVNVPVWLSILVNIEKMPVISMYRQSRETSNTHY